MKRTTAEAIAGLCFYLCASQALSEPVEFGASLKAGEAYKKELGNGILFQIVPNEQGWTFGVVDEKEKSDLATGFNYPIRWNGTQYLDGSYGEDEENRYPAKRSICFLNDLSQKDKYGKLASDLYWPSKEKTQEMTMKELAKAPVGFVKVDILKRHIHHKENCNAEEESCNVTDGLQFRATADVVPPSMPDDIACVTNYNIKD